MKTLENSVLEKSKFDMDNWKNTVHALNGEAMKIINDRDDLYKLMADYIRKIFAEMNLYPEDIHINSLGDEIKVKFPPNDEVIIDPNLINMKFRVTMGYNDRGNSRIVLVVYPFKED